MSLSILSFFLLLLLGTTAFSEDNNPKEEILVIEKERSQDITRFGVCKKVTTPQGKYNLYIPTKSDREWSSFYNNPGKAQIGPCDVGCRLPWGGELVSNSQIRAYQRSSVPYGGRCVSQMRTCNNGTLSGSYRYRSCSVQAAPRACRLPWGGNIAHGRSVRAYRRPAERNCAAQTRRCNNGSLSGSYNYRSCRFQGEWRKSGGNGNCVSQAKKRGCWGSCTQSGKRCSFACARGVVMHVQCR